MPELAIERAFAPLRMQGLAAQCIRVILRSLAAIEAAVVADHADLAMTQV